MTSTARGSSTGIGELALIDAIAAALERRPGSRVVRWLGDDAAVVRAGALRRHLGRRDGRGHALQPRPALRRPRTSAGARSPARCPTSRRWAPRRARPTSASCCRRVLATPACSRLHRGAEALARETGTTIAGGDLAAGPALMVAVTVVGWADREDGARGPRRRAARRPRRRHRDARRLGGRARRARGPRRAGREALVRRHLRPLPRLAEGRALARAGATAMLDLSDGLASDARRLAEASGVTLALDAAALPLAAGVARGGGSARPRSARARRHRRRGLRAVRVPAAGGAPRGMRRASPGSARSRRAGGRDWRSAAPGAERWRGWEHVKARLAIGRRDAAGREALEDRRCHEARVHVIAALLEALSHPSTSVVRAGAISGSGQAMVRT